MCVRSTANTKYKNNTSQISPPLHTITVAYPSDDYPTDI